MKRPDYNDEAGGSVSEWHEGTFKNIRLHEAQEIINSSKINPLAKRGLNWNYEMWIYGLEILYGEGYSKYDKEEINEVEKVRKLLSDSLNYFPVYKMLTNDGIGSSSHSFKVNWDNWEKIKNLIEIFERRIKKFNDIHGLSTKNVDYDLEGL